MTQGDPRESEGAGAEARGSVRPAAMAGSWYPQEPDRLAAEVDRHLREADQAPRPGVRALIAPHAGLVFSGPVAAHAYAAVRGGAYDVAVLVGPSHRVGFDGVALDEHDAFDTPLGPVPVDAAAGLRLRAASTVIVRNTEAHRREHSLELQLPFLRRVLPDTPIVPLVIGFQRRATILALADALAIALSGARSLLVASTDLSHYFDAGRAAALDARVVDCVDRFDADALLAEFERYPEHERGRYVACGGGAAIAVMRAARALGANHGQVLVRSDSAAVSGDLQRVVGYLAAVLD
ncbi:MAG: AmmeMemoRadiSam system protein B [Acidobacteria bacterium]|nr:AmmeMemoRadiSam system protein B [Acidobacteriota bacterium]